MAFNKFMHPRNRYKDNKPNFDELAEKYPDFGRHVIRNQAGKATLDFHDAESLRSLTCTLLEEDFGLKVELPLDRLIPTLSLRLNYIHWMEDLLASTGHSEGTVWGIDIGCGASCIYPLLGAQMNGWNFIASEVDALAIHYAKDNITRNGLGDKITVVETVEDGMFEQVLNSTPSRQPVYHFTMCNPPFFGNSLEAQGIMTSRNMSRPEPKSVSTAAELEMIAEGGEVEFVRRMIEESLQLRNQIVWYTSMLGKKSSLSLVREELRKRKIRNVTHTEFCQGRTMRWGIAWTFKEDIDAPLPACKRRKLTEKTAPFTIPVPDTYIQRVLEPGLSGGLQNKIQAVAKAVHHMMEGLEMSVDRKPSSKWCAKFDLTAAKNTWSHQRRKRRLEKRLQMKSSFSPIKVPTLPVAEELAQSSLFPSSCVLTVGEERPDEDSSGSKDKVPSAAAIDDERVQGVSDHPGVVSSCPSSNTVRTTDTPVDGSVLRRILPDTSTKSAPGKPIDTSSQKPCNPPRNNLSEALKASSQSLLKSTHLSQEDIHGRSHDCAVEKLGETAKAPSSFQRQTDIGDQGAKGRTDETKSKVEKHGENAETPLSSQHQTDIGSFGSKQPTEAKGRTDKTKSKVEKHGENDGAPSPSQRQVSIGSFGPKQHTEGKGRADDTKSKDQPSSSSDEADESFPLDMHLDVKLGDRRTIVLVVSMADSTKRNLLHQVVQYIKNQMK